MSEKKKVGKELSKERVKETFEKITKIRQEKEQEYINRLIVLADNQKLPGDLVQQMLNEYPLLQYGNKRRNPDRKIKTPSSVLLKQGIVSVPKASMKKRKKENEENSIYKTKTSKIPITKDYDLPQNHKELDRNIPIFNSPTEEFTYIEEENLFLYGFESLFFVDYEIHSKEDENFVRSIWKEE